MARFNRRFEVKREMKDGGNIRPDDSNANSERDIDSELLEELQKVGFDDMDLLEEESIVKNLSETEIRNLIVGYRNMAIRGELDAKSFIGSQSKKLGVDKEELETFLKEKGKQNVLNPKN